MTQGQAVVTGPPHGPAFLWPSWVLALSLRRRLGAARSDSQSPSVGHSSYPRNTV